MEAWMCRPAPSVEITEVRRRGLKARATTGAVLKAALANGALAAAQVEGLAVDEEAAGDGVAEAVDLHLDRDGVITPGRQIAAAPLGDEDLLDAVVHADHARAFRAEEALDVATQQYGAIERVLAPSVT